MAAIGGKEPFARRVEGVYVCVCAPERVRRKCGKRLHRIKNSFLRGCEDGDGRVHLAQDINVSTVTVRSGDRYMARTGAWREVKGVLRERSVRAHCRIV